MIFYLFSLCVLSLKYLTLHLHLKYTNIYFHFLQCALHHPPLNVGNVLFSSSFLLSWWCLPKLWSLALLLIHLYPFLFILNFTSMTCSLICTHHTSLALAPALGEATSPNDGLLYRRVYPQRVHLWPLTPSPARAQTTHPLDHQTILPSSTR